MILGFPDWIKALCVLLGLMGIILVAEWARKARRLPVEKTRKFVHLISGLAALSFAYIFRSHWTVLVLTLFFSGIMGYTKRNKLLPAIHQIDRESYGGLYFPLAIYITFLINSQAQTPHFYLISILILSISDSLAALIGKSYGFKLYQVEEDHKSLEGSLIFFFTAFVIAHLGLLLFTPIGRLESVLSAVYIALLVTAFEAISLGGADNILIPIGTSYILQRITTKPLDIILGEFIKILLVLLVFSVIARISKKISHSGLIGLVLLGYGAWALMDFFWFLVILLGFLIFTGLKLKVEPTGTRELYQVRAIFLVGVVSLIWLIAANFFYQTIGYFFLSPFLVNITVILSVLWKAQTSQFSFLPAFLSSRGALFRAGLLTLLFMPVQLWHDPRLHWIYPLVSVFIGILLGDRIYFFLIGRYFFKAAPKMRQRVMMTVNLCVSLILGMGNFIYYNNFIGGQ